MPVPVGMCAIDKGNIADRHTAIRKPSYIAVARKMRGIWRIWLADRKYHARLACQPLLYDVSRGGIACNPLIYDRMDNLGSLPCAIGRDSIFRSICGC